MQKEHINNTQTERNGAQPSCFISKVNQHFGLGFARNTSADGNVYCLIDGDLKIVPVIPLYGAAPDFDLSVGGIPGMMQFFDEAADRKTFNRIVEGSHGFERQATENWGTTDQNPLVIHHYHPDRKAWCRGYFYVVPTEDGQIVYYASHQQLLEVGVRFASGQAAEKHLR